MTNHIKHWTRGLDIRKSAAFLLRQTIFFVIATGSLSGCYAQENVSAESVLREALTDNPLLASNQLEVSVNEEANGYVILTVTSGSRDLRQAIANGLGLQAGDQARADLLRTSESIQAYNALSKWVAGLESEPSIKAVHVTASTDLPEDHAQDLFELAVTSDNAGDHGSALLFLEEAAARDLPAAKTMLGFYYLSGTGVKTDQARAFGLFSEAAADNYPTAHKNLANMYLLGVGADQDQAKAIQHLRLAAKGGDSESRSTLAWQLATSTDESVRDAEEALRHATHHFVQNPSSVRSHEVMAASLARAGEPARAAAFQRQALKLIDRDIRVISQSQTLTEDQRSAELEKLDSRKNDAENRLKFYREGRSFTQP